MMRTERTQLSPSVVLTCVSAHRQALPDMLEVLPPGASKGKGVEVLLAQLGIDPLRLMALGEQASKRLES